MATQGWENYSDSTVKTVAKKSPKERMQALGRMPKGKMNKTEAAYARHLDTLIAAGDVIMYDFERINIRLANQTYYKIDFLVLKSNMQLEAHEVKGYWTDDARVKIKCAAEAMPYLPFFAIKMQGGGWQVESF